MSQFTGKWKLHSSENFDEFLKVMGAPWIARKMAGTMNPDLEVTVDGDHYSFKMISTLRTKVTEFTVGVEFEDEAMDGRKYTSIVKKEGENKLVEYAKLENFEVKTIREVQGDELVTTIEVQDVVAVRRFRRE